ncbi:uncharacterized protein [Miscanthus floridulus]|uniref:uncharacterized protein n=1 Tax=Miscanthus floridulus TaxID=154761 RepID=UPI003458F4F4
MPKRLHPRSSQKRHGEVPALAPCKALKVSPSSTAHWVVEAQSAIQRGTALARADPKEPVAQGEAAKVAPTQVGEGAPMPHEAEAHESYGAEAPSVTEATEGETEAPRVPEAEVKEAGAPRSTEAKAAETGAPGTTEAGVEEAGVSAAKPTAQEAEMKAAEASVPPPMQGPPPLWESAQEVEVHSISSDDTSWGKEGVDAEAASTVELPAPTSGEGGSALVRERDVWDQLQRQKNLLAGANELLSMRSAEVEDLRLRCANAKAEAATVREQDAPLAARVKELEEELTRVPGDQDAFRSRAKEATASVKALAGQLGAEQGLEKEVSWVTEASVAVQAVLDAEIGEHNALQSAARTACEALEVEGVQSGSSLGSHLIALSGQVRERLRGALHTGVKRALAIVASHYIGVDLEAISDSYVLPEDDEEADEEVTKLMESAEGPGTALAKLFEEEVVPPPPSADAGDPEP